MYIELVKTDIVNNLKEAKSLNLTTEEHDAFLSLVHNDNIIIRISKYMEKKRKEMDAWRQKEI